MKKISGSQSYSSVQLIFSAVHILMLFLYPLSWNISKLKRLPVTCSALKRTSNISQNIAAPSPHSPLMQWILVLSLHFRSGVLGGGVVVVVGFLLSLLLFLVKGFFRQRSCKLQKIEPTEGLQTQKHCLLSFLNLWLNLQGLTNLFFYLELWESDFLTILFLKKNYGK